MKAIRHFVCALILSGVVVLAACQSPAPQPTSASAPAPTPAPTTVSSSRPAYLDPALSPAERAADLLGRMSLAEKIGQMTQVEKGSITPQDVGAYFIGSVLSGGGGSPSNNAPTGWRDMVEAFQAAALSTPLRIPLIYGVDAVHGHGNARGATIFPQNIGLGATRNPDLVRQIARATANEMAATGAQWNFSPVAAVPQDVRWGRTFEGFGESPALVSELVAASVRGMQEGEPRILATPKHFLADGGTSWGTSTTNIMNHAYQLDQGDARMDEATLRGVHLAPYQAAISAGARSIMVSFSSWNGVKMHAHKQLLTDVLKGELGFSGFLVSDWQAIDQIPGDYYSDVVTSVNAGLDMVMVPYDYKAFIAALTTAAEKGDVPQARIDDAVRRILTVKFEFGLFEQPLPAAPNPDDFGGDAHRALARQAVRESLVLLKNEGDALPLSKDAPLIFVAGQGADDIGIQCGGWTMQWQGAEGDITPGTTLLAGIQAAVGPDARVEFNRFGKFARVLDAAGQPAMADVGIAVVAERPYAEGVGDSADLALPGADLTAFRNLRERSKKLVLVVLSGRPVNITDLLPQVDAVIAAWLPGTEGAGVADVLFGDHPFTGRLSYTWPRSADQLPFDFAHLLADGPGAPLFPNGFGLTTTGH